MDERLKAIVAEKGVFLRSEAIALGYDDRAIGRQLRADAWHRVRRGAYVFAADWAALDAKGRHKVMSRAVLRAAKTGVVLSHTSALLEYGVPTWTLGLGEVHLTRTDRRGGRRESGVRQHRGLILPGDVSEVDRIPLTSGTRTALDITTIATTEQSLVAVDGLLHAGLTTRAALEERYGAMTQWANTLHTDLILRLADGRAESAGETRSRYLCWRQGLPKPEPQFEIRDERGRLLAKVDLAWPELGVFAEFDGQIKYGALLREGESPKDVIIREQRREEMICELTGWTCIRIVWSDLQYPEQTAARIARQFNRPKFVT